MADVRFAIHPKVETNPRDNQITETVAWQDAMQWLGQRHLFNRPINKMESNDYDEDDRICNYCDGSCYK